MANLRPAPGFTGVTVVTPATPGQPQGLIEPDRNNLSPRLGLAWRPFDERRLTVRAGYGVFFDGSVYGTFPSRLAAQPPFATSATLNSSYAWPLTLDHGLAPAPVQKITNTYAVDRNFRVGYAQTWNFSLKQDFDRDMGYEIGYLGTKGTRLNIERLPNRAAPGSPLTAEERRQISGATGFAFDSSEGNSVYHAAQFKLIRRFHQGIGAEMFYTFSKSIDNVSNFGGAGGTVAQDDRNLRAERGLSAFDRRHSLNLSWLWMSPLGDQGGSLLRAENWASRLFGNWSVSGALTAGSGLPFTAAVAGNRADAGGTGAIGAGRADASGLPVGAETGYFNPAAFRIPPAGRFGNAARNTIPGPGLAAVNLALARSFRLRIDGPRLELRAECANMLNHANITAIGTTVNAADYGLATAAGQMRVATLTLRLRF
jgi:hypothetical protein